MEMLLKVNQWLPPPHLKNINLESAVNQAVFGALVPTRALSRWSHPVAQLLNFAFLIKVSVATALPDVPLLLLPLIIKPSEPMAVEHPYPSSVPSACHSIVCSTNFCAWARAHTHTHTHTHAHTHTHHHTGVRAQPLLRAPLTSHSK